MLKEKKEKNKNAGESKNKASANSSQGAASSESSGTVKEEKAESGGKFCAIDAHFLPFSPTFLHTDCGTAVKKEQNDGRKSATPVKSEPGSVEKANKEPNDQQIIKSEGIFHGLQFSKKLCKLIRLFCFSENRGRYAATFNRTGECKARK